MIGNQPYRHKPLSQGDFGPVEQGACTDGEIFAGILASVGMVPIVIYFGGGVERRDNAVFPEVALQICQATFFGRKGR